MNNIVSRDYYYRAVKELALAYQQQLGSKYNEDVSKYFHKLVDRYPDPISNKKVGNDIAKILAKEQSMDRNELIDRAEQAIRSTYPNKTIPFQALMTLNRLRSNEER